jgi:starch phosphorylase
VRALVIISVTPEIALEGLYTYAGGLGVLEGDKFLGAAKKGIDYVVLTLFYEGGYVDYEIKGDEVKPLPQVHPKRPEKILEDEGVLKITLRGEEVVIKPYVYKLNKAKTVFFRVMAPKWAQKLVQRLYMEENENEKVYKYIVLAKASANYVKERIGLENIEVIDLQEAYSVLTVLALPEFKRFRFVTHTPGPWGHPFFPKKILEEEFDVDLSEFPEKVMLTRIGMQRSETTFTVSKKHYDITKKIFKEYANKMKYITNGVCIERWLADPFKEFLKEHKIENLTLKELKELRSQITFKLIVFLKSLKGVEIGHSKPILLWARRITKYKRPYFIIRVFQEHPDIADKAFFIVSGKPHPKDKDGMKYFRELIKLSNRESNVIFVPHYDLSIAKVLLAGTDYLLFTPFSGWEACGTSYMKSMINGVPVISSRDGAAIELIKHKVNGYLFGRDLRTFVSMDSDEARKVDEKDFEEFVFTLEEAISTWKSEEYFKISLNAMKSALEKAPIVRILAKYYPWREELKL